MDDRDIGSKVSDFYVALRDGSELIGLLSSFNQIEQHALKHRVSVDIELWLDCQRKLVYALRQRYGDLTRGTITLCRKKLTAKTISMESSSSSQAQRHLEALVELLGSWSNGIAELHGILQSSLLLKLVVSSLHGRVMEMAFECFNLFKEDKKVDLWYQRAGINGNDELFSISALDFLLSQLSGMREAVNQYHCFVYSLFLSYSKVSDDSAVDIVVMGRESGEPDNQEVSPGSSLQDKELLLQTLASIEQNADEELGKHVSQWRECDAVYIALEYGYLTKAIAEAFSDLSLLETEENVWVAQCVEDFFFLLKHSSERAIATGSVTVILSVGNKVVEYLDPHQESLLHSLVKSSDVFAGNGIGSLEDAVMNGYDEYSGYNLSSWPFSCCMGNGCLRGLLNGRGTVGLPSVSATPTAYRNGGAGAGYIGYDSSSRNPPTTSSLLTPETKESLGQELAELVDLVGSVQNWFFQSEDTNNNSNDYSSGIGRSSLPSNSSSKALAPSQTPMAMAGRKEPGSALISGSNASPTASFTPLTKQSMSIIDGSIVGVAKSYGNFSFINDLCVHLATVYGASVSITSLIALYSSAAETASSLAYQDQRWRGCASNQLGFEISDSQTCTTTQYLRPPSSNPLSIVIQELSRCQGEYKAILDSISSIMARQLFNAVKPELTVAISKSFVVDGEAMERRMADGELSSLIHRSDSLHTADRMVLGTHCRLAPADVDNSSITGAAFNANAGGAGLLSPGGLLYDVVRVHIPSLAAAEVVRLLSERVAEFLFHSVLVCEVNEWGALLFQEEVARIFTYFQESYDVLRSDESQTEQLAGNAYASGTSLLSSSRPLTILSWAMKILTLDQPADIRRYAIPSYLSCAPLPPAWYDHIQDHTMMLILDESTVRGILARRIDFSKEAVQKVKIQYGKG